MVLKRNKKVRNQQLSGVKAERLRSSLLLVWYAQTTIFIFTTGKWFIHLFISNKQMERRTNKLSVTVYKGRKEAKVMDGICAED